MKKPKYFMFLFGILAVMFFTFPSSYAETIPTELYIMTGRHFDVMDQYEKENDVSIVTKEYSVDIMDEIANGFVTKNENIDIYIFDAHNGLYYLKEKGYYYPLNSSPQLMEEYANLYPAFQKALSNHGDLAAWVRAGPIIPHYPMTLARIVHLAELLHPTHKLSSSTGRRVFPNTKDLPSIGFTMRRTLHSSGLGKVITPRTMTGSKKRAAICPPSPVSP